MPDEVKSDAVIVSRDLGKAFSMERKSSQGALYDRIGGILSPHKRRREPKEDRTVWALRHVDFQVRRGEIFGIVGRNGSGKTTLLSVLARVTAPTEGMARITGRVAPLLGVGAGFHPQLTGRDNIALSGAIQGMTPDEVLERFDDIVEFSEVGRYIDQPVKHYSSGMFVRLAFSVAAFMPAEIMLIDEVLAVGDAEFKKKSEKRMTDVLNDGRSVVYVGHGLDVVRRICTHAIVLEEGQVAYVGTSGDAVDYYEQEVVARRQAREKQASS